MPRNRKKARKRDYSRMSFRDMADKLGLTPKQRVKIAKYINKQSEKG